MKLSYIEFHEELKRAEKALDKLLAIKAKSYPNFENNLKLEIILNKLRSDDLTSEEAERLAAEYFVLKSSL